MEEFHKIWVDISKTTPLENYDVKKEYEHIMEQDKNLQHTYNKMNMMRT